ncbi:hypothetical protein RJT34_14278 [Clitoria ternatea]|uniref:Uncharacterized protein n=1 Tax=Clitoria ternatea TaxID=43366 RepID=A0AAN9JSB3_CLITE
MDLEAVWECCKQRLDFVEEKEQDLRLSTCPSKKSILVHLEMKQQRVAVQAQAVLLIMLVVASPIMSCPPTDGSGCKDCIVNQMINSCPPCTPILHCMARCLWDGSSRPNCIKKCDCNNTYPTLSDCKRCMYKCKCSCLN